VILVVKNIAVLMIIPLVVGGGWYSSVRRFFAAFEALQAQSPAAEKPVVILPTPQGESLKPELLRFFSLSPEISILAGHYKGVDETHRRPMGNA
jgi:tRNA G37 N-methylase TrmD